MGSPRPLLHLPFRRRARAYRELILDRDRERGHGTSVVDRVQHRPPGAVELVGRSPSSFRRRRPHGLARLGSARAYERSTAATVTASSGSVAVGGGDARGSGRVRHSASMLGMAHKRHRSAPIAPTASVASAASIATRRWAADGIAYHGDHDFRVRKVEPIWGFRGPLVPHRRSMPLSGGRYPDRLDGDADDDEWWTAPVAVSLARPTASGNGHERHLHPDGHDDSVLEKPPLADG